MLLMFGPRCFIHTTTTCLVELRDELYCLTRGKYSYIIARTLDYGGVGHTIMDNQYQFAIAYYSTVSEKPNHFLKHVIPGVHMDGLKGNCVVLLRTA